MRLRAAHVGPVNYVPVCLVIADYFYDGAYRSFPFVVSQDKMRSAVANAVKSGGASPIVDARGLIARASAKTERLGMKAQFAGLGIPLET